VADLAPGGRFVLALSTEPVELPPAGEELLDWASPPSYSGKHALLTRAASQFLVIGERGPSVIAGYPWFTDWGRDAMIALPGLARATGNWDHARGVLETFASTLHDGLLPNRFVEGSEAPDYGSVDAALWFAHASADYVSKTKDLSFLR